MFNVPNNFRLRKHPTMASDDSYGNNGVFIVEYNSLDLSPIKLNCIASDMLGWEHVSITLQGKANLPITTPTWEIMNYIKDLFWGEEDCVIQYHPPKSKYVNCHNGCLHLWRPIGVEIPIPPHRLIGV